MVAALEDAAIAPGAVACINAHGTSTPLGASGGIEIAVRALTLATGTIAPTINLDTPDLECDLDYTPRAARDMKVSVIMSNNFGFGGHNVSLVLGRV